MPHAYWSGFLRLSLVSCPIYISPATSERERISLHQINPKTGNRIRLQPVDAETGEELLVLVGHTGRVYKLDESPVCAQPPAQPFEWCGRYIATAGDDGTI